MKEIKLTIDGKKVQLTAEQIKALGIEVDNESVCDMVADGECYYFIDHNYGVIRITEKNDNFDNIQYKSGNYYRSESYAKQVAMHQMLNNLLRRYSEQHGGDDEWDGVKKHYYITFVIETQNVNPSWQVHYKYNGMVYFNSEEIADKAIEEVVEPFMAEHPEFVW